MAWLILLGIAVLQGLTEFLPVSSSGHLTLGAALADLPLGAKQREAFFVFLHGASLVAIVVALRKDIFAVFFGPHRVRLILALIVATVPAGVTGLVLHAQGASGLFENLTLVGAAWIVTAVLLLATRRADTGGWSLTSDQPVPWLAIVAIGAAQAFAIQPGISRSGATIAVALLMGMERTAAFRFSFLMAIPVIGGALLVEREALVDLGDVSGVGPLALAFVACALVSLWALTWLRALVAQRRLAWFAPYCAVLGLITLIVSLSN